MRKCIDDDIGELAPPREAASQTNWFGACAMQSGLSEAEQGAGGGAEGRGVLATVVDAVRRGPIFFRGAEAAEP